MHVAWELEKHEFEKKRFQQYCILVEICEIRGFGQKMSLKGWKTMDGCGREEAWEKKSARELASTPPVALTLVNSSSYLYAVPTAKGFWWKVSTAG